MFHLNAYTVENRGIHSCLIYMNSPEIRQMYFFAHGDCRMREKEINVQYTVENTPRVFCRLLLIHQLKQATLRQKQKNISSKKTKSISLDGTEWTKPSHATVLLSKVKHFCTLSSEAWNTYLKFTCSKHNVLYTIVYIFWPSWHIQYFKNELTCVVMKWIYVHLLPHVSRTLKKITYCLSKHFYISSNTINDNILM